jgi:hypothetical protein
MARFSDNAVKTTLVGTEVLPATDMDTNGDIGVTPATLATYINQNVGLASAGTAGLMSPGQYTKLGDLYTKTQLDTKFGLVEQQPLGMFFATPSNGLLEIFQNPCDALELDALYARASAGSAKISVRIDGADVTGFASLWVVAGTSVSATASAANAMATGAVLGLNVAGAASAANLAITIKSHFSP